MQVTILSNSNVVINTAARPSLDITPERIMREAYEQLIRMGCADLNVWQEVHRIKPDAAVSILMMAMMRQGMDRAWPLVAQMVMELTMSPAHLYLVCDDGVDYDEAGKTAVFISQTSRERFSARFPEWVTAVQGATNDE